MKCKVFTDKDGYITGYYQSDEGIDIEITNQFLNFMNCYKLNDNKIILDNEKYEVTVASEEKEKRINEILKELEQTDYVQDEFINSLLGLTNPVTFITDLIALISNVMKDYPSIINERKTLIAELESLLK